MLPKEEITPQDITFTVTVGVQKVGEREATVSVPVDLRLTQKLVDLLRQLVQAQGLTLTNMNISSEHQEDLRNVENVVVVPQQEKRGN